MTKIKVLELCHFSAGICGVWNRVKEESQRLNEKGYEVRVFSSNAIKGSNEIASSNEIINKVKVKRFHYLKLGGESFLFWNFIKDAIAYAPDVIITHVYRHIHTTNALNVKKELEKIGKKCIIILVTHAPFNEEDSERGLLASLSVKFYDKFIGKRTINKFDKIITISNWELPYLLNIGANKEKIFYLPNGVPEIFFKSKPQISKSNKLLFLGRISKIKNLELAILVLIKIDKKYFLELVGSAEEKYKEYLQKLVIIEGVDKRVLFSKPICNVREKIKKIDSSEFFILPSKREGMSQSLIEAMARGKICIGSDAEGIKDIITDGKNGFIFKKGDLLSIARVMNKVINLRIDKIKSMSINSRNSVLIFKWDLIIDKLDKFIKKGIQEIR